MRPSRRQAWICWGIIVGSLAYRQADAYFAGIELRRLVTEISAKRGVEIPPPTRVEPPAGLTALACAALALFIVASLFRRGRACMRMRPRLSRTSTRGDIYLEAFAFRTALAAMFVACSGPWLGWTGLSVTLWLVRLEFPFLIVLAFALSRCRSWRVPAAEWGWRSGSGVLRELAIGLALGVCFWLARQPLRAGLSLLSIDTVYVVSSVVLAPLVEETLYRGMLYRHLRDRLRWAPAVVVSAAVFALMHFPRQWPSAFAGGLLYALLREWRGSLVAPIAAHFAGNLLSVAALGRLLD